MMELSRYMKIPSDHFEGILGKRITDLSVLLSCGVVHGLLR